MNNEFFISMGVGLVLQAVKNSFKNEKAKASLKKALLKVYQQIKALYADDPDFA